MALENYKLHLSNATNNEDTYIKEPELLQLSITSKEESLSSFDSMATMGNEVNILTTRDSLIAEIDIEHDRYLELNSLRNPFKDIDIYAIPIAMTTVGWGIATIVDVLGIYLSIFLLIY
jgi:hypothetical protein